MLGLTDAGWPLGRLFQTAYVTNDLPRAVDEMCRRFDIPGFYIGDVHGLAQLSGGEARIRAALAWVGTTQIEIIEPCGGNDALYRDFLSDSDFALRHHHFCGLIADQGDFDKGQSWFEDRGFPLAVSVKRETLHVFYVDARPLLSHYLEYIWIADDSLLTIGGKVPVYGPALNPRRIAQHPLP